MPDLVLHTHNLAKNNGDVERRMFDFRQAMRVIRPDLILAQEVSSDIGFDTLIGLTHELGPDYDMVYAPIYPRQEDKQGVAIISQLPFLNHFVWPTSETDKKLQVAEVQAKDDSILLTNAHLQGGLHELTRLKQVRSHNRNVSSLHLDKKQIMAGDFNTLPNGLVMMALRQVLGYESAVQQMHGHEPEFTFPCFDSEELIAGRYINPAELAKLQRVARAMYAKQRLLTGAAPDIPRYTIDYALTKNMPRATSASVLINASTGRPAISDHAGLTVGWPL